MHKNVLTWCILEPSSEKLRGFTMYCMLRARFRILFSVFFFIEQGVEKNMHKNVLTWGILDFRHWRHFRVIFGKIARFYYVLYVKGAF